MFKYEKLGEAIKVSLNNIYEIIAMAHSDNDSDYLMNLYLSAKDIQILMPINDEPIMVKAKKSNIRGVMSDIIEKMYLSGSFDENFNAYEFEMRCFDLGIELLEQQYLTSNTISIGGDDNVLQ